MRPHPNITRGDNPDVGVVKFLWSINTNAFITAFIIVFAFSSECPTIGKFSRGKGSTMQSIVSYYKVRCIRDQKMSKSDYYVTLCNIFVFIL